jgi:hypothetical protein
MKKIYSALLLLLFVTTANAQSFKDLKNGKNQNPFLQSSAMVFFRYTHLKGKYTDALSAPTINIAVKKDKANAGGLRYRFENPYLGDGIYTIVKGIKRLKEDKKLFERSEQSISSGFVGWHQLSVNLPPKERFSPGISFGDVLLATKRSTNSQSGSIVTDPAGYYFFIGPSALASYLISDKLWIDGYLKYDLTLAKVANPKSDYVDNPNYPLPSLITIGADLYTTSKVFGGLRLVRLLDRGSNNDNGTRIDLSVGIVF